MLNVLKRIFSITAFWLFILWGSWIFFFASKGTNVAFQSSDGNWADNESLFKGRDFESIVYYFESYKIRCNVPDAILQRITDKPVIFSPQAWFDDYSDKKWKVPLVSLHQNLHGKYYYPDASAVHCYNKGAPLRDREFLEAKVADYLSSL